MLAGKVGSNHARIEALRVILTTWPGSTGANQVKPPGSGVATTERMILWPTITQALVFVMGTGWLPACPIIRLTCSTV